MQSFTRVLPPVRRVAVAGGTHGNEMSGVCLARHWLGSGRAEVQRPHIQVEPFLANTRAVERCVRYIDADLNRMFTDKNLRQPKTENPLYEVWRAQQINETYGPIGSESAYDMLLDMHNTTSNMGISLVLTSSSDHLSLHMAQFLQRKLHPIPCNAVLVEHPTLAYFHLRQVAKHGLSVEIGPQPQGVARADITEHMRRSIAYCLDFMHKFNSGMELPASKLDVHRIDGYIDYPRDDEGHITAIIHPAFQDQDWQPLHPGTPIFVSLSGEAIAFEGQEIVFPVFINEAAYYEKKIAFWITKRETLNVEPLRVEDGPHKECTSMVA